ncbi:hypothetical protein [Nodularia sp. NIES-3585]|nr:hypothetical protein [Nodularia sp. NIES-3585]
MQLNHSHFRLPTLGRSRSHQQSKNSAVSLGGKASAITYGFRVATFP